MEISLRGKSNKPWTEFSLFSVACILLFVISSESANNTKRENELPKFYFESQLELCPLDSPELYYEEVAFTSLSTVIQEGRVFFGVLLDNLESALSESEEYEKLQETWEYFTKIMSENFDMKAKRIDLMWDKVITIFETKPLLPWEVRLWNAVVFEIFCGLHYEYLVLEAMVKSGVKEIVGSLQGTFGKIIREVGETVMSQGQEDPEEMFKKAEELMLEIEPNFVGKLLSRMLKNGRRLKNLMEKGLPIDDPTFVKDPVLQIGIVVQAFRDKSHEFPNFWQQMAVIMKNGTQIRTGDEIYLLYSKNEEKLLTNILNLMASIQT